MVMKRETFKEGMTSERKTQRRAKGSGWVSRKTLVVRNKLVFRGLPRLLVERKRDGGGRQGIVEGRQGPVERIGRWELLVWLGVEGQILSCVPSSVEQAFNKCLWVLKTVGRRDDYAMRNDLRWRRGERTWEERRIGQGWGICREARILNGRAAGRERERRKDFRNLESGWMWLRRGGWLSKGDWASC